MLSNQILFIFYLQPYLHNNYIQQTNNRIFSVFFFNQNIYAVLGSYFCYPDTLLLQRIYNELIFTNSLKKLISQFQIALLLAGIIALKKIMSQKNSGGGGHESHGWSSGGGSSGGWDRRSYNDVSELAYSAYKKQ